MRLTAEELDRLTIFTAAELARRRRDRGLRLAHPEAVAIIADEAHEAARAGLTYAQVVDAARRAVTEPEVMDGVAVLVGTVKVECRFADGTRLVVIPGAVGPPPGPQDGS